MKKQRLGCLSFVGIFSGLVTLTVIGWMIFSRGGAIFSPGELNAQAGQAYGGVSSHAEIGGQCAACHAAPWDADSMADRCIVCHTNVGAEQNDSTSLHGAILINAPASLCADCHLEHGGPTAALTRVEGVGFPHEVLGYSLNGHQLKVTREPFACEDCHTQGIQSFAQSECTDCHRDLDPAFTQAHLLSWGSDCLACHDGVDTYNNHFDHGSVPFALTGLHVNVNCYSCHLDARSLVDLRNTPQTCADCHFSDDPHAGRFGNDCSACHSNEGWTPAKFDHNLAAFKLEGEHAQTACESCHVTGNYSDAPTTCVDCHAQEDEHNGSFGTDCSLCHVPTDWDAVTFDHNQIFPLYSGHAGVACESCHINAQFAGTPNTCAGCHSSSWHASAFGSACANCHTLDGWGNARYGLGHPWFNMNHETANTCTDCHPSSVYAADCETCHRNEGEGGGGDD